MLRIVLFGLVVVAATAVVAILSLQGRATWTVAEVVRTPEERFANLSDYPFAPHYVESLGYRIHYVDEGPRDGEVILLLHGQPSWSYLYRHMIPPLAEAGYRVIAPDFVGFGKSDKPLRQSDYSYQMHVDVMTEFVHQLDLQGITMFAQDWGGPIGLRLVAEDPDRFARIMISNTGLPAADGLQGWLGFPIFRALVWLEGSPETLADENGEFSFTRWVAWSRTIEPYDYEGLFQAGTERELTPEELAGYSAPFPNESYQAGARIFPYLVPSQLREGAAAMRDVYANWDKPFLTAFGDSDPVTGGMDVVWHDTVPGAQGQPHTTVENAGHFIQEDQPDELVRIMTEFIEANQQ